MRSSGFIFGIAKWDRFWFGYPERLGLPEQELENSEAERRIGLAVEDVEEKLDATSKVDFELPESKRRTQRRTARGTRR